MRSRHRRSGIILLAALLLLGQGVGLHHEHADRADCPPGACLEHLADHAVPASELAQVEHCPLCEIVTQSRSSVPIRDVVLSTAPRGVVRHQPPAMPVARAALDPAGSAPRAPPSPA